MDNVGVRAVQSLATDIANLTARLAVSQAILEDVSDLAAQIDLMQWEHKQVTGDDTGMAPTTYVCSVPGAQVDVVNALLAAISGLR